MLTNCLAECAHLTITVNESEILVENRHFFILPLHSTPMLGGAHQNITTPFGVEKLEWCGYPMVKKFRRYLYSFWRNSQTWQTERRTDNQTDTTCRHIPRLCIASRGKNYNSVATQWWKKFDDMFSHFNSTGVWRMDRQTDILRRHSPRCAQHLVVKTANHMLCNWKTRNPTILKWSPFKKPEPS